MLRKARARDTVMCICARLHGSSGPCETFGNPCLASSEEFGIRYVEVRPTTTVEGVLADLWQCSATFTFLSKVKSNLIMCWIESTHGKQQRVLDPLCGGEIDQNRRFWQTCDTAQPTTLFAFDWGQVTILF
jgi:hypothetical protein